MSSSASPAPSRRKTLLSLGVLALLTGIVVSVSVTAVMLALTIRLYQRYHTLDLDEIYMMARQEEKAETASKEGDAK